MPARTASPCIRVPTSGISATQRRARPARSCSPRTRSVEFNIEGNPFQDVLELVLAVRPHQCTLVPDAPGAMTSDHGWNLAAGRRAAAADRRRR